MQNKKTKWFSHTCKILFTGVSPPSHLGMLYSGVILKQATTALRLCLDSSLCHTIFLDLKGCSVCKNKMNKYSPITERGTEYLSMIHLYISGVTHHFKVIEDSRHLLHSLDHFLGSVSILSLSCHLFVQGHLPAHGRVVHLSPTHKAIIYCAFIYYLRILLNPFKLWI